MLANQITNHGNLFEIGSHSLQFVVDFMYALEAMDVKKLHELKKCFDTQDIVAFKSLIEAGTKIAELANITNPNQNKN